ncbi:sugar ABC transporter ATP-binding protein [Daejeonella sp.]|jgi:inositol transport system ATP-binding protein|uniref:sugar ABC transporter ATP-binding protein n=1 Tax=Daejeonella sp. TaxID=2805397 RepID=UPI0027B9A0F8|nr:sugar ABC transporter ATP-binding protein [Daejeonella sp.]
MPESDQKIIDVKDLNKSFSGIKALDNIQFDLYPGEVHALMGENGAGKSTFMKILMGLILPDSGSINFNGEFIENMDVHKMLQKGISMIHQEILMVPELTIAQNIFLGREVKQRFWLDEQEIDKKSEEILNLIGLNLNVQTKAKQLSIAEMQLIEIAKAISNHAKVIIMDEPTSALSDKECEILFKIINDLKSKGVGIIYISHKIEEIFQISDRITVLRDGQYIATKNTNELDKNSLISLMVGREIENLFSSDSRVPSNAILEVRGITKKDKFENINFQVHAHEVLGIAGLMGAGRTEIARAIFGLDKIDSGEILLKGHKIEIRSPKDAIEKGIAYVSEDRKALGFIPEMSMIENISLSNLKNYSKGGFIQTKKETKVSSQMADDLKIKAAGLNQKVINLSGGNQQKIVIAKALLTSPDLLILDEPTRGIDIGAKHEIYKLINQLANNGLAVIIISSELPEILGMSDRILVLSKGKQTAILNKQEASQEKIMHYAIH